MSLASTDLPRRHRYSVSDYYLMGEVGILAPDSREELIHGDIFDRAPPTPLHAATVTRLNKIFQHASGDDASVSVLLPVRLSELSEPGAAGRYVHARGRDQPLRWLIDW